MKNTLKIFFIVFLMKGCNLINITLLILCESCTTDNVDLQDFYKFLAAHWKDITASWLNWGLLIAAAVCIPVAIFGGLYVYRNGWRSLVPQSWRKTDN